jgi:hypothetical protein
MNNENNNVSEAQVEFEEVVSQAQIQGKKHNRRCIVDRLISAASKLCVTVVLILAAAAIINSSGQQPWNPSEVINEYAPSNWVGQQVQKVKGYNTQVVNTGFSTWAVHRTLLTNKVDKVYLMIPYIGWVRVTDEKYLIKG